MSSLITSGCHCRRISLNRSGCPLSVFFFQHDPGWQSNTDVVLYIKEMHFSECPSDMLICWDNVTEEQQSTPKHAMRFAASPKAVCNFWVEQLFFTQKRKHTEISTLVFVKETRFSLVKTQSFIPISKPCLCLDKLLPSIREP